MMDEFVRWAMGLLHAQNRQIAQQVMNEVTEYLQTVIKEKAAHPDGGAVSAIVYGRPGGEMMTGKEIFGFVFFLFIAGLDTVFVTLNNIFVWLAENPDRRREIMAESDNINNVVEELLRVFSVTFSGRTLTQDYVLRGVQMKKGDRVTSILPACNYDPDVFPNLREVDFHRPRKPILAFAGGVHSCMGAHLARLEIKICIEEFLGRIAEFEIRTGKRSSIGRGASWTQGRAFDLVRMGLCPKPRWGLEAPDPRLLGATAKGRSLGVGGQGPSGVWGRAPTFP